MSLNGNDVKSFSSSSKDCDNNIIELNDNAYNYIISPYVIQETARLVIDEHQIKPCERPNSLQTTSNYLKSRLADRKGPGIGVRLNPSSNSVLIFQKTCDKSRLTKFLSLINSSVTDLNALRTLAWSGVPSTIRSTVWKLLAEYLPAIKNRRNIVLLEKRRQYNTLFHQFLRLRTDQRGTEMILQIQKDITRMSLLNGHKDFCDIFERVLFTCSVRRPASGYVQGINDLLTPFFVVFIADYIDLDISGSGELRLSAPLRADQLNEVEADTFWCLSRLLDTIQDHYTLAQPGIQNSVFLLTSLVMRLDPDLHNHLTNNSIEYLQFTFRWMNNLLIRELPLRCVIRLWDTYMSEPDGFSHFHVYVCAAFLLCFASELKRHSDFQNLILMLQSLPTQKWNDNNVTLILAEAFKLKYLFNSAPRHLDYEKRDIN